MSLEQSPQHVLAPARLDNTPENNQSTFLKQESFHITRTWDQGNRKSIEAINLYSQNLLDHWDQVFYATYMAPHPNLVQASHYVLGKPLYLDYYGQGLLINATFYHRNHRGYLLNQSVDSAYRDEPKTILSTLSVAQKQQISLDMCEGLTHLHKHGIIHGDVTDDNILFWKERAVLKDYEMARTIGKDLIFFGHGTYHFCAPELYAQTSKLLASPVIDVYGAAATIARLFTANHELSVYPTTDPVETPKTAITTLRSELAYALLTGKNEALKMVLEKALSVDPKNRYQSIPEFQSALIDVFAAFNAMLT